MAGSRADQKVERFIKSPLGEKVLRHRRLIVIGSQLLLVALAYYFSFVLQYAFKFGAEQGVLFLKTLIPLIVIKAVVFFFVDLYRGWWRYVGMHDLIDIIKACFIGSFLFGGFIWLIYPSPLLYPKSLIFLDFVLCVMLIAGIRFLIRAFREFANILPPGTVKNALIYGSREIGVELLKEIKANPQTRISVVGFIDDFAPKKGFKIHGIPILGGQEEIPAILQRHKVDEIIITTPSLKAKELKALINKFKEANVRFKIVPPMSDILTDKVSVHHLRDVQLEDLLGREAVNLDSEKIQSQIKGKTVLITGAGGSIGSELARQVASFEPSKLVLFERNENNLFMIQWELQGKANGMELVSIIGDILDTRILEKTFSTHKPEVVYHAAAYKHVPMMETHPLEAVKNNILGTLNVANQAMDCGTENFVLISTDKAVRPTNIMGMTKRVAEKLVLFLQSSQDKTRFVSVRFGNVMGSTGSVIPLFQRQIDQGGPVTVTHPDAMRYFMTITEAVQLVMQAAAISEGGELFILEMGEQIKIVDLARNLIRLSGLEPDRDIEVVFTGLRPGEKLSESLFDSNEGIEGTVHEKIKLVRSDGNDCRDFMQALKPLLKAADAGMEDKALSILITLSNGQTENGDSDKSKKVLNLDKQRAVSP